MTTTTASALATRDEYADAIGAALRASAAYYGSGESALDDASFDLLLGLIKAYEERYPEHTDPASPTGKVAGGAVPAGDVPHTAAMLSLGNVFGPQPAGAVGHPGQRDGRRGRVARDRDDRRSPPGTGH
ncbi:hypothetical protein [Streptomyces sp. ISL-94]|uniref:hypothetical protein n=1 Tax=Streptomyces sp. ISL-94 TaxID=2819190 RepID=UPI0020363C06|nr:hypothetical protein [Streptomyces sp. ISL-94]